MRKTKCKLTALMCSVLAIMMLVSSMTVFAAETTTDENVIKNNITSIEEELSANNTDVVSEINAMIDEYSAQSIDATEEDVAKYTALISTLEDMRDEYALYDAGISTYKFHAIYSPAVASVIAFFNMSGYKLAAELLAHARDNTKLDSSYIPTNGNLVKKSSVFKNIANGTGTKGSASFENSGSTEEKDLYYAIHSFNWTKSSKTSKTVKISDRYDYKAGDHNGGIAGVAIDTMAKAQDAGVIVPYYVNITATL